MSKRHTESDADKASEVIDDSTVFIEDNVPKRIRLIDGTDYDIPPCSFRNELKILKLIGDTIGEVSKSGIFSKDPNLKPDEEKARQTETQMKLLTLLFSDAPERVTSIAAAICGQDDNWALDNLDSERVLEDSSSLS